MKKILVGILLAVLSAVSVAPAAPWEGRRGGPEQQRGAQPQDQQGQWRGGPPPDRRMDRDDRRGGALSEEERRGLHRDLDRANRELYRRR